MHVGGRLINVAASDLWAFNGMRSWSELFM